MQEPRTLQQVRAKRTRRHLLAAAGRVFAELGYAGATVDDIAEAAGCSKGAYYFHFETKEDILAALIDAWIEARSAQLDAVAKVSGPASLALRKALDALFSAEDGYEPRLLTEFWSQAQRSERLGAKLQRARRTWQRNLTKLISEAQAAGALPETSPDAQAAALLAMRDGLTLEGSLGRGGKEVSRSAARTALIFLEGGPPLRKAG